MSCVDIRDSISEDSPVLSQAYQPYARFSWHKRALCPSSELAAPREIKRILNVLKDSKIHYNTLFLLFLWKSILWSPRLYLQYCKLLLQFKLNHFNIKKNTMVEYIQYTNCLAANIYMLKVTKKNWIHEVFNRKKLIPLQKLLGQSLWVTQSPLIQAVFVWDEETQSLS